MDVFNFFEIKQINWRSRGQSFSFTSTSIICQYQKKKYQNVLYKFLHTANHLSLHLKIKKRFKQRLPLNYELVTTIKFLKKIVHVKTCSKNLQRKVFAEPPHKKPLESKNTQKDLPQNFL